MKYQGLDLLFHLKQLKILYGIYERTVSSFEHQEAQDRDPSVKGLYEVNPKIVTVYSLGFPGCNTGKETQMKPCDLPELRRWSWESEEAKEAGLYDCPGEEREAQRKTACSVLKVCKSPLHSFC